MNVWSFRGKIEVDDVGTLLSLLKSERLESIGAFILERANQESLWVHINGDVAYLHYFPNADQIPPEFGGSHPGYQATDMMPQGLVGPVWFEQPPGPGGGFEMPAETLVSVEAAYQAAAEFFHSPGLPPSITWSALCE
jgi:hypothetical protein